MIFTYLYEGEYTKPTSDSELNSLLAEVRQVTGDDWRIAETIHRVRRWFRAPQVAKRYELYHHTFYNEFQIINFYRPEGGTSICTINDAGHVAAYLYGILAGSQKPEPQP